MENTKKVDINVKLDFTSVKKFAFEQLPSESPLREVLLAENDKIDITTFLARIPIFLHLSNLEKRGR